MISFQEYTEKFSDQATIVVNRAMAISKERGHSFLAAAHVILALFEGYPELMKALSERYSLPVDEAKRQIENELQSINLVKNPSGVTVHSSAIKLFKSSLSKAQASRLNKIDVLNLIDSIEWNKNDSETDDETPLQPTVVSLVTGLKNLIKNRTSKFVASSQN